MSRNKLTSSKQGSYQAISCSEDDDHYDDVSVLDGSSTSMSTNRCTPCCDRVFPAGFWPEFTKMFAITWPICVTQICQMIIGPLSLIFCGHLGDPIKLDGAALAISMINATCISVGQGLGTACDTFFSQTYGSSNRKRMGVYLQRAFCIFTLALIVCCSININMELILRLLGQHPEVSRLAGRYMLLFIPGAVGFFMYIILAKYIQNQNIVIPNVVIGLFANGVNAILHYVFLYKMDTGTDGSAIAMSISYVLMFVLTLMYILIFKVYEDTWDGWSWDALQDWGHFCRLAIPGMLMVCLEWWGFEIGVFLTGLIGTTELGAQSVLLQIDSIWFQVPLGIQIACSIRVGQYIGSANADGAVTAARLALLVVTLVSIVVGILFMALRYQLPYMFTNVEEIAELTGDLLPIVTLYIFFDGIATACKGVLYGTGRQTIGAILLFVSYYCLSLPIGIPLMFLTDLSSAAYWWALAINLVLQATVLLVMVMKTNWEEQIIKAKARAGVDDEEDEPIYFHDTEPLLGKKDPHKKETTRTMSRQDSLRRESVSSVTSWPGRRVSRLVSTSLTAHEVRMLMIDDKEPVRDVIIKRLMILCIFLTILGVAIAVSIMIKVPDHSGDVVANSTATMSMMSTEYIVESVTVS